MKCYVIAVAFNYILLLKLLLLLVFFCFFFRVNIKVSLRWFMLSPHNPVKSLVGMSLNTLSGGILEG